MQTDVSSQYQSENTEMRKYVFKAKKTIKNWKKLLQSP